MPFTLSHPAVILPLKKLWPRYFSLSGLIAGAMSPDLQYFLLGDTAHRGLTHSWLGLLLYCLPLGVGFAFVFHYWFKRPFFEHLPRPLDRHFSGLAATRFRLSSGRGWLVLIVSVLIGAVSHFAWDSFTHENGVVAQHFDWLLRKTELFGMIHPMTVWLQHLSSWLGLAAMALGLWKWKLLPDPVADLKPPSGRDKWRFWIYGGLFGIMGALIATAVSDYIYGWNILKQSRLIIPVQSLGLGCWAGLFWYCCGVSAWRRVRTR